MKKGVVSVLKTSPESVSQDYGKLMGLAGFGNEISPSKDTLLKINLSWTLFYPSCSTPPWQLDGVCKALFDSGFKKEKIFPVENETVVTKPRLGAKLNKWDKVLGKYELPFIPLNEVEWVNYKPKRELMALDSKVFPEGFEVPKLTWGQQVIHLPTLKTHGHTITTGAMKNAIGGLLRKKRHHSHKFIHEVLVDLLVVQKEIHPGIFAVMDGTVCGNGAGPRTMDPVIKDYLLASADQVAIDAVSAHMMGFEPLEIPYIKWAHDLGLGCGDFDQIDIVGEDVSKTNFHFSTGKSPVVFWDQMFRKGVLKRITEPLLFHTPLFNLCIAGSCVYHDYAWYPTMGKKRVGEFMKTKWGKVFQQY